MKIISLKAENIKKLVAVEINPDSNVVQITGKNGQGKTSVLDSIWWALAGSSKIQPVPIRKGETKAVIRLDLGDLVVTRTFKEGKDGMAISSIFVENADGARFPSPQSVLDKLIGSLSFDPLAFARMTPHDQFNTLRKFVPDVDFDLIDGQNRADYETRTAMNRSIKELSGAVQQIVVNIPDSNVKKVDDSALIKELELAGEKNTAIEREKNKRGNIQHGIVQRKTEAQNLRGQAEEIMEKSRMADNAAKQWETELKNLPPLDPAIDVAGLSKKIEAGRVLNTELAKLDHRNKLMGEARQLDIQAKEITDRMAQRQIEKQEKIASAKLPVNGITFGDGSILMNSIPFEQISDAEQLKVSLAIAMSLNPKLRVIRVRDGSLLDEDSMKIISEMAKDKDFQIWIERVDGSGKVGFVLEDGSIKSNSAKAVST